MTETEEAEARREFYQEFEKLNHGSKEDTPEGEVKSKKDNEKSKEQIDPDHTREGDSSERRHDEEEDEEEDDFDDSEVEEDWKDHISEIATNIIALLHFILGPTVDEVIIDCLNYGYWIFNELVEKENRKDSTEEEKPPVSISRKSSNEKEGSKTCSGKSQSTKTKTETKEIHSGKETTIEPVNENTEYEGDQSFSDDHSAGEAAA